MIKFNPIHPENPTSLALDIIDFYDRNYCERVSCEKAAMADIRHIANVLESEIARRQGHREIDIEDSLMYDCDVERSE